MTSPRGAPAPGRRFLSAPALLTAAAFVIRAAALLMTFERAGDGPTRATMAYDWSLRPFFVTHGAWPPGFLYLSGAFTWLVPDPVLGVRAMSLSLGTLTVPMFYALVRTVFGAWPALFAASILAVLPLHVGLSASSLTEAAFLFFLFSGTLLFLRAWDRPDGGRRLRLWAGVGLLVLASSLRYEAWVLLPAFPLYALWKSRRWLAAGAIAAALAAFPVAWMLANRHYGLGLLAGFSAAVRGTEAGPRPVSFFAALSALAVMTAVQAGFLLPLLAAAGLGILAAAWLRRGVRPEEALFAALFAAQLITLAGFAAARGNLWPRYLLFSIVASLPYAALPLEPLNRRKRGAAAIAAVVALSFLLAPSTLRSHVAAPEIYLTRRRPVEWQELAQWLRRSGHARSAILITKLDWESSYLFLFAPEVNANTLEVNFWVSDAHLSGFCRSHKPELLITSDADRDYQRQVQPFLPVAIRDAPLVHVSGPLRVYDVRAPSNARR